MSKSKTCRVRFLFIAVAFLTVSTFLSGIESPEASEEGCVTVKCHPDFGKEKFVHELTAKGKCSACHEEVEKHKFTPIDKNSKICGTCHTEKIGKGKFVHGPVATGQCTMCHNPHQSRFPKMLRTVVKDVCFICHKKNSDDWDKMKYKHGPNAIGGCVICHDPHSSNNMFHLRIPAWDLCVSCHKEKASGKHVISGFVSGNSHPTKGKPDPTREGRELTCSSCHNPHASDFKDLFNFGAGSRFSLCGMCHKK